MTTQELKSYVKDVFELEKQIYTYEQIKQSYDEEIERINDFGFIFNAENPTIQDEWLTTPEYKQIVKWHKSQKNKAILGCLIKTGIAIALLVVAFNFSAWLGIGLGIFVVPSVLIGVWFNNDTLVNGGDYLQNELMQYYERCTYKLGDEVKESMLPTRDHLIEQCNKEVVPQAQESYKLVNYLYGKNIIHPKYQNIVAMAQIYEYFDTGRCTELEGPNGAYNLYESELRANLIIDNLSEIATQLQEFNRNMSTLTNSIVETNNLLSSMRGSLERIEANTALTAYNTQCTAFNTELLRRYS